MRFEGEENRGSVTATAAHKSCIRIYVGGLGGSVTADDLKKTFSSPQLGNVNSVEIVRTKGRSFAYLDFLPISDKGLTKLFSMYNGCMWKGARLRLEKAKEHYLIHLKREWAEDAELNGDSQNLNVDAVGNLHSSERLLKIQDSEKQIRIFFPKLRKVKPLPLKGTGKHKYSFQHIQVPPLPTHFCNCEEHCVPFEPDKPSTDHEKGSGRMNDEELSMMNSIMSKILQRESCSEIASRTDEFATEAYNTTCSNDDLQHDDALADQECEDNLIINMVAESKSNSRIAFASIQRPKAIIANQDSQALKTRPEGRRSAGKLLSSNKKRKAPLDEEADTSEMLLVNAEKMAKTSNSLNELEIVPDTQPTIARADIPQSSYSPVEKSAFGDLVSATDIAKFHVPHIRSDVGPKAEASSKADSCGLHGPVGGKKETTEAFQPTEEDRSTIVVSNVPNAETNKTSKSSLWLQKSSWMQLVGGSTDSSFSISQILPGLNVEGQELQPAKGTVSWTPIKGNNENFVETEPSFSTRDVSKPLVEESNSFPGLGGRNRSDPAKLRDGKGGNEASTPSPSKKHPLQPKQTSVGGTETSETFTFMRTASSMKEWMKTKAALSSSLKKKRSDK